jgi:MHS family proline/betaine transporter-like MFS transporter
MSVALSSASTSVSQAPSTSMSRVVAAGVIGNVLEWYDFAIYGYFATSIGRQFFPHEDAVAQLLSAFGIFALGYMMRPVGGVLIGHIGDRYGRRAALTFSVAAMAIPTFLIGLLPGYAAIGLAAPIALTVLRMVQGLSVGGEYTSSMVFLVEHAPDGRRGLLGALTACGATGGILLGSAVGAGFAAAMSNEALEAWGWRIPFLLGLVIGIAGYFLRRHVQEVTPAKKRERAPLMETLRDHWRVVLSLATLSVFNAVPFYVSFVYLVSWLQTADGIAPARALEINSISMAVILPILIATGMLSDRLGRKPLMLAATVLGLVAAVPIFWLLHHPTYLAMQAGQLGLVLIIGLFGGPQPSLMVEATPPQVRCTAVALGYNVTLGIIGGLTPLAATWLVARTGNDLSPAFLIMAAAVVATTAIWRMRETYRLPFIGRAAARTT